MTPRPSFTRVAALLTLLLAAALPLSAQPLADRVPADALLYVGWAGADSMGPGYANSHLKAVLDASQFNDFFNRSLPALFQKIGATDRQAAEATALMSAIGGPAWRHSTALYFGGVDPQTATPRAALLCDAGAEGKALADAIRKALANLPPKVQIEEQGGLVMVSVGAANWGAAQKPANPLSAAKGFTAALAQAQQKDASFAAYVDVEGIVKQVDALAAQAGPQAQNWPKTRDALGLNGVKRAVVTAGFDGRDWATHAFVDAPAPRTGPLPSLFNATPLSTDILKAVPHTATVAAVGKFDLGALVTSIRSAVTNLAAANVIQPDAGQQVDDAIKQVNGMLGFDVQADLLNAFGDEWAVYSDPMSAGSGMLGFTLVNRARDARKLEASLTKLEDAANGMIKSFTEREQMTIEVKRVPLNGTTLHHLAVPFVSPSWAIKNGNWYLGLYPQVVEAALEQGASSKSILDNEDFAALRKRLNVPAASGYTFANLPKTAPDGYQEIMMMSRLYLGMADLFGADVPPMLLPPLRKIMPHLSPAGSATWADAAGWHYKAITPFPGAEMLTPGGGGQVLVGQQAMLAGILLPSLTRAREQANRVKCASNMRQIGMGMLLYANENKGKYPPDLGSLLAMDLTPHVFVCPSAAAAAPVPQFNDPKAAAKWVNENAHYVYLGAGKDTRTPADVIVLYEKPDHHQQGVNALFGDGHVEFLLNHEFQQRIQQQGKPKLPRGGGL